MRRVIVFFSAAALLLSLGATTVAAASPLFPGCDVAPTITSSVASGSIVSVPRGGTTVIAFAVQNNGCAAIGWSVSTRGINPVGYESFSLSGGPLSGSVEPGMTATSNIVIGTYLRSARATVAFEVRAGSSAPVSFFYQLRAIDGAGERVVAASCPPGDALLQATSSTCVIDPGPAGTLLVVTTDVSGLGPKTVSDSKHLVWTRLASRSWTYGEAAVWVAINTSPAPTLITFSYGATTYGTMSVFSVAGPWTSATLDGTPASATGQNLAPTALAVTPSTTATLLVGTMSNCGTGASGIGYRFLSSAPMFGTVNSQYARASCNHATAIHLSIGTPTPVSYQGALVGGSGPARWGSLFVAIRLVRPVTP